MQSVRSLFRLGLSGLLLDPQAYRDQRDSPQGLRRGLILIVLVGLLVGVAALIGDLGELVTQPRPETVAKTIYDGIRAMPWFADLSAADAQFPAQFNQLYTQISQAAQTINGGGLVGSLAGIITTPLAMLAGWLLFGAVAHLMARTLGGRASFTQTLACTALSAGVGLLGLVQVIPYAQLSGTTLFGLVASYVAIREAHDLTPWRAFWATVLGPALLALALIAVACVVLVLVIGAIGTALPGGSQ
jgi:hypothetical protein